MRTQGSRIEAPPQKSETPPLARNLRALLWAIPLLLQATDAHAWGLYTHMYFAQLLVWSVPLADARFRRALLRFPELCLAATCLPDVSLFSRPLRAPTLHTTHRWSAITSMLLHANGDEQRAMALGYASHLLTDIVAHNYFVPAHERMWLRVPMLTHAASEWAMDAHVAQALFVNPASLIERHRGTLVAWAGQRLGFSAPLANRALGCLMY
ncbi:MAG: zinc dependent phospholipase C family protein, partial [Burkholderiales bacterium]